MAARLADERRGNTLRQLLQIVALMQLACQLPVRRSFEGVQLNQIESQCIGSRQRIPGGVFLAQPLLNL